ncbi:MAG: hypothetical protein R2795_03060 [Saprospiraceae bacterium]
MFKYTRHSLKKLSNSSRNWITLYAMNVVTSNSGYCIVEDRKIAVINKFYETEGRINVLLEILNGLAVDETRLEESSRKFYRQLNTMVEEEE